MTSTAANTMPSEASSTEAVSTRELKLNNLANSALKISAQFWFLVAVIGQWLFVYYIAIFYGGAAVQGDWEAWNKILNDGIIAGDTMGNVAVAVHILLAAIITIGGPLQLIPHIRARAPSFHRWNGRVYVLTAFAISIGALYLVLTRGTIGGSIMTFGMSLNAVLIMVFAAMAVRYAIARKVNIHRRWALRLFMVVSGVWFFRVDFMLWMILTGGIGVDIETFQGPFLNVLSFAQYLLPLAVLEVYLRTQDRSGTRGQFAMATGLLVLTVAMGVGAAMAFMGMWLPQL